MVLTGVAFNRTIFNQVGLVRGPLWHTDAGTNVGVWYHQIEKSTFDEFRDGWDWSMYHIIQVLYGPRR
eukprot:2386627-Rhodomonas_salina.1